MHGHSWELRKINSFDCRLKIAFKAIQGIGILSLNYCRKWRVEREVFLGVFFLHFELPNGNFSESLFPKESQPAATESLYPTLINYKVMLRLFVFP